MLAPRPTKLRSQRDINLWRIPLQLSLAAVALFAITLIPDILDKYGVIHIPSWLTMGSIDDARAILSAMMGAVATVLALIFSVCAASAVEGWDAVRPASALPVPAGLGHAIHDRPFHGHMHLPRLPCHASRCAIEVRPAGLPDHEL